MIKPEEKELENKKEILAHIEETLASCELEIATLKAELLSFEQTYAEIVGGFVAELDEIEAQIAEFMAKKYPANKETEEFAQNTRKQATESARSYQHYQNKKMALPRKREFAPTEDLKQLFREVAKRIHPDLASSDRDRALREELMKKANEAYQNGDEEKLKSILEEYESHPEGIEGNGIGVELIRAIRSIDLISQRIAEIKKEIEILMKSELYILKQKVDNAKLESRDLLIEMASYLRLKIQQAKNELRQASQGNSK